MENFSSNSNFSKKIDNEKEKAKIEKDGVLENSKKKVDFKLESSHSFNYYGSDSLKIADSIKKGYFSGEIDYRGFFIQTQFDYTLDRYEVIDNRVYQYPYYYTMSKFGVGYKKVLNDFFYSETDYNKKSSQLKEEIVKMESTAKIIEKKEEIIDKYVEIMNLQWEIELKNKQLEEMKETHRILGLKLNIKESTKIDYEILGYEMEKLDEDIKFQERTIENKKNELFKVCGVEKTNDSFVVLDEIDKQDKLVTEKNIEVAKLQITLEEEGLKYIKRQNQWPVELFAMYESVEDDYQVGLNFNMDLFNYRIEKKQKIQDIENKEIDLEDEKINYESKFNERENQYNYLKKTTETMSKMSEVYEKKYNATKNLYEYGDVGLLDYLKIQTETYKVKIEYEKNKNSYYGLLYKINLNIEKE